MDFDSPLSILESPAAQEILAKLSHEEKRALLDKIKAASELRRHHMSRISMVLGPIVLVMVLFNSWIAFGVFIAAIAAFLVWQHRNFRQTQVTLADILCSSAYGKSRGFQQEQLL